MHTHTYENCTLTCSVIGDPAGSGQFPEFKCLDSVSITITYDFNLFTIYKRFR